MSSNRKLDRNNIVVVMGNGFPGGAGEEISLKGESPLVLPNVYGGSLKSLKLKGGAITQEGTPTPDDPKPILIGGKELKISADGVPYVEGQSLVVSGKNLYKFDPATRINGGVLVSSDNGEIVLKATTTDLFISAIAYIEGTEWAFNNGELIPLEHHGKIYVDSGNDSYKNAFITLWDADKKAIKTNDSALPAASRIDGGNTYFDATNYPNAKYMSFRFSVGGATIGETYTFKPYVGYTPFTAYEPYHEPYRLPLPLLIGTDEADITSGEVTRKWGVVDLGTLNWTDYANPSGNYRLASAGIKNMVKIPSSGAVVIGTYCNRYAEETDQMAYQSKVGIAINTSGTIVVYDPYFNENTSAPKFKEAVKGVLLVYPLATPITSQIPPTSVPLVKPTSVLTSYASSIEATYKAKQKPTPWFEYVVGLNTSVDYSTKTDLTAEGLANIITNSAPTHAIVIKLSETDYNKCASGGAWYTAISSALSTKPLVSIAK